MGCAYIATKDTDAKLPHVAETFNRMFSCIVVAPPLEADMRYAVVRPSSIVDKRRLAGVRAQPSIALVAGTVRSSNPTVGR
jgi:hypothetical protein